MMMRVRNLLSSVVVSNEARAEVCRAIEDNAKLDLRFVFMNGLAAVIASYGLLAGSTATVIGAMVIATLLGAISGIALALVHQDSVLLRQALKAAGAGVALVLGISLVIGWFHQWMPLSSEILVRTNPNILDLAIALAGGAAGAYATVSPRVSAGLVGVAIATALVPPVAASGLCLRGEFLLACGAFELFLTNFAAIQFTTSVMMWVFGFHQAEGLSWFRLLARNRVSIALMLVLGTLLTINLVRTVGKHQLESAIRQHVAASVDEVTGAELIQLSFKYQPKQKVLVTAVIVTPERLAREVLAKIKSGLPHAATHEIDLRVQYVLSASLDQLPEGTAPAAGHRAQGERNDSSPTPMPEAVQPC